MTQPLPAQRFATTAEVAALIGVDASTLPAGVALIEEGKIKASYIRDLYDDPRPIETKGDFYIWRDATDVKIAEVRIAHDQSIVNYQKIDYDAEGRIKTSHDQLSSGKTNTLTYHDNGVVSHARYGREFDSQAAALHQFFDRQGRLHNIAGLATYVRTNSSLVYEKHFIHGAECLSREFDAHPERKAYLKERRWYNRFKRKLGAAFKPQQKSVATPANRQGMLKIEALVHIAAQLSDADKLLLLKAISPTFNGESRPDVESATVTIYAPKRTFKAARPSSSEK